MSKRTAQATKRLLPPDPAPANYFLDRGFSDLGATAKHSLKATADDAVDLLRRAKGWLSATSDGILIRLAAAALFTCAGAVVAVFGTAIVLVLALLHAVAVAACAAPQGIAAAAVGALDAAGTRRRGVRGLCPVCKAPFTLPGYRCPSCGAIHYRLRPNKHGVLHHTCRCGQKLPCTRFGSSAPLAGGASFKRADLQAVCTNPAAPHPVEGTEARAVCIALAGARSTGKTAFLNAAAYGIMRQAAPARGLSATCGAGPAALRERALLADYAAGEVSLTAEPTDPSQPTAAPFTFRLEGPDLDPARIVHLMDVAGEAFVANAEHERQLHYGFADGVVLMLDPMSIPQVGDALRRRLGMVDAAGVGAEDPNRVLAALVAKMQDAAEAPAGTPLTIPLAVVLGKIDQAGLARFFDADAQRALLARNASLSPVDAHDALCRAFLADHGMGNFLNAVDARFKTARFFACSAIGHARGSGPYAPVGVAEPLDWILRQSDPALAEALALAAPVSSASPAAAATPSAAPTRAA